MGPLGPPTGRRAGARLLGPVRDEDVRLADALAVAVRGEDELPPVRREHREAVEAVVGRDPLEAAPVVVHEVEVEVPAARVAYVRGEDDPPPVRMEEGREARRAEARHLVRIAPVRVHHPDLELPRPDELAGEERAVLVEFRARRGTARAPHDAL